MQPRRRVSLGIVVAILAGACGDGPTVAKLQPTLTVVSGQSSDPAAAARVVVAGESQTSDGRGRVYLSQVPVDASEVDVHANGFLLRRTTFASRDSEGRLTLWPLTSPQGITEQFTRELVYTSSASGVVDPPPGGEAMRRWAPAVTRVDVVLLGPDDNPGYLPFTGDILARQREAVTAINESSGALPIYSPPREGDDVNLSGTVRVRIFPEWQHCVDNPTVNASASLAGPTIRSAVVTYCRTDPQLGTMIHELGHTFGLRHTTTRSDMMYGFSSRTTSSFNERERVTMKLMMQRPAGNRFPDDDRTGVAAASPQPTTHILCE